MFIFLSLDLYLLSQTAIFLTVPDEGTLEVEQAISFSQINEVYCGFRSLSHSLTHNFVNFCSIETSPWLNEDIQ